MVNLDEPEPDTEVTEATSLYGCTKESRLPNAIKILRKFATSKP